MEKSSEIFSSAQPEQEPMTIEKADKLLRNFLESLTKLEATASKSSLSMDFVAPEGFGYLVKFVNGRCIQTCAYGDSEPIEHDENYPFVVTLILGEIMPEKYIDKLLLFGSDKLYAGHRSAILSGKMSEINTALEFETVKDNGIIPLGDQAS